MTIIWFTDQDRQRMREEREALIERSRLFWEFVREEEPFGVADRRPPPYSIERMGLLDIRPWPEAE